MNFIQDIIEAKIRTFQDREAKIPGYACIESDKKFSEPNENLRNTLDCSSSFSFYVKPSPLLVEENLFYSSKIHANEGFQSFLWYNSHVTTASLKIRTFQDIFKEIHH